MIRKLLLICLSMILLAGTVPMTILASQAGSMPEIQGEGNASGYMGQDEIDQETLERIHEYVARQFEVNDVVGGSYAIVHAGEVIDARGIGVVDLKSRKPVTPETVYAVASVTKSLTAAAVLKMYEQGMIELDAPVQTYIPWFTYRDPERSARVTIRHLLTHAAGIHRFEADGSVFQDERENRHSLERTVRALSTVSMTDEPGTKGAYCNSCYNVLGLMIEEVARTDYEQYMKDVLFGPLHMDSTSFDPKAAEDAATEYNWVFGWKRRSESNLEVFGEGQNPEGGIYSNVIDLSKYLAAMLGTGEYPLLRQDTLEISLKGEIEADEGFRYAISGFEDGMLGDTRVLYKAGDGIGSGAVIVLLPEQKLGISLLIGESIPELGPPLAFAIAKMLLGENPEDIEVGVTFWRLVGWISLGCAAIGLLLLAGLLRSIMPLKRAKRRIRRGLIVSRAVVCLIISLPIAYLLVAVRPTQIGFYGYPYDLAIGMIAMMASTALWAVYSVIQLSTSKVRGKG